MIDNLDKLQKYVDLLKEDEFLYIEIIIRNKDSGNLGKNSRILKTCSPRKRAFTKPNKRKTKILKRDI